MKTKYDHKKWLAIGKKKVILFVPFIFKSLLENVYANG